MNPVQSKIIVAFGNQTQSQFLVPCGIEVIVYEQTEGTVELYSVDDVVNKLAASSSSMAVTPTSRFTDIPLFNRDLTAQSNIYQRTYFTGNSMPDFSVLYASAPPLQKSITGIYIPSSASIHFSPDGSTATVGGIDTQNQWLIGNVSRISEILYNLAAPPPVAGHPIRCLIVITPPSA